VEPERLEKLIGQAQESQHPEIFFVKRMKAGVPRLGVFASSFNPVTCAHLELIRRAADQYSLDEVLALAGILNADKTSYDCPLNDRLQMLLLSIADEALLSVAVSSSAFFVDMVDAIATRYSADTEIYFLVGFDTFERILDPENKYLNRYYRRFADGSEAIAYLLERSHLIVAGRNGQGGPELSSKVSSTALNSWKDNLAIPAGRVFSLDFPEVLSERSSSEVRQRVNAGLSIEGLVPPAAERYIQEHRLYRG